MTATRLMLLCLGLLQTSQVNAQLPAEPVEIGHEPQFLFDNHLVDNHWAIRYKRQAVRRVFHQAQKHPGGPVLKGDQASFLWVVRDKQAELFRMYYQANFRNDVANAERGRKYTTRIAYAESKDGVEWTRPDLGLFDFHKVKPNNVVVAREGRPEFEASGPVILDVPDDQRRGHRWLMLYRAKGRGLGEDSGIHLAGSDDGIHWKPEDDLRIAHLHSDHHNTISWDPRHKEFVMFCRAKHIYRAFGSEMLDTGASRRVARFASPKLWTDWLDQKARPQTVLVPDEIDSEKHFNFFYGMPTRYRYGVYWGFLEPFRMNDFIQTELAVSRDGFHFTRFAGRKPIIPYGEEGSWDDEMIFASPGWVEVGDEWWIYYSGWDGPHGTTDRTGAIGLAKIRKEGFISIRGPAGGGVVCTRVLRWPGGDLIVNADCGEEGVLRVRVTDPGRKPIVGLNYDDCQEFRGDSVSHKVTWKNTSVSLMKGQLIRLEFYLQNADLYTFRAGTE